MKKFLNSVFCVAFLVQGTLPVFAQSITPDPAGNAPGVLDAANGVPIVNIVAPTDTGLSHNKFLDFNVGSEGLILNNSTELSQSQLGGVIEHNPNLGGKAATIILNEVTSSSRSLLQGPTEVHGQAADYILVNPNGMTCNGCGFINIPRATLSTGIAQIENGAVKELVVEKGAVTIGPDGLSAQKTDYFDIVARSIEVNGKINAGNYLGLFAGRNIYDPSTGKVSVRSGEAADKPAFGIDSSALGGMYAGRITLVGTENGVGVRAPDKVVAATGGFKLDASGKISLGGVNAAGKVEVKSSLDEVKVREDASVYAEDSIKLTANEDIVLSAGTVVAGAGDVALYARNLQLDGKDVAAGVDRKGEDISGAGVLTLDAGNKISLGATVTAKAGLQAQINAAEISQFGTLKSSGTAVVDAGTYTLTGADAYFAAGSLEITTRGLFDLQSETQGIASASTILLKAKTASLQSKVLAQETITVETADALTIGDVLETDGDVQITSTDLTVTKTGRLVSGAAQNLSLSSLNNQGILAAGTTLDLSATEDATFADDSFTQSDGVLTLTIGGDLSIGAMQADREATLFSNSDLTATVSGKMLLGSASAKLASTNTLNIDAAQLETSGKLEAKAAIELNNLQELVNHSSGEILSDGTLKIAAQSLENSGYIYSKTNTELSISGTSENALKNGVGARLESLGLLDVTATSADNEGVFTGGTGFSFTTSGDVTIKKDAVWQTNAGTFLLSADNILNQGAIASAEDLVVRSSRLTNDGGVIFANNDVVLEGKIAGTRSDQLLNQKGGAIESLAGNITIRTEDLQNLTTVERKLSVFEYANNYITYTIVPKWIKHNRSVYSSSGAASNYTLDNLWSRKSGPSGYIFLPDIVMIRRIQAAKGAAPDEWNPNWWKQYAPTSVSTFDPSKDHLDRWNILSPDEEHKVPNGGQAIVYIEREELEYKSPVSKINSGTGNITIDAGSILNEYSHVTAAKDLTIDGGSLTNRGLTATETYGVKLSYNTRRSHRGFGWVGYLPRSDQKTISVTSVGAAPGIFSAGGTLSGTLSGRVTNAAANSDEPDPHKFTDANNIQILPTSVKGVSKDPSLSGTAGDPFDEGFLKNIGLTTNIQLFAPAQEGAKYLIETRFKFVDVSGFFGHDYFAEAVGIPSLDKFGLSLGDAYFETRLINDQIIAATGERWISDGVTSDAEQARQLMHNAAEQAQDLQLTYGVALSATQVSLLTKDIVWYEKTVIDGREVVVPRVYLADSTKRNTDGAILAGRNVQIAAADISNTRGRIASKEELTLAASGTLTNTSGTLSGKDVSLTAEEIVITTATKTTGNGQDRVGTIIGERGRVSAENSLKMTSTGDTLIAGADLSSGGSLEVSTGGSLKVTGVEAKLHFDYETRGNGVHRKGRQDETRFVKSTIQAADDLKLKSEKDISIEGALVASDGTATIEANEDVTISSLEESTYSFSNAKHKGFLSGKTRRRETATTEQVGSLVSAVGDLTIKSNSGSVDVTASNIASKADVTIEAAKDVNLNTATNTTKEDVLRKSRGFFASAGGGKATVGYKSEKHKFNTETTTHIVSSVSGENITIKAGEDVTSNAAALNAEQDLTITAGKDINLNAATDTYAHSESHKVDTIALSISAFENVTGAVKTIAETPEALTAGKGNAGYKAITAVSAGLKAAEAASSLVDMAQNGGTVAGVSVGLSVSREKNSSQEQSSAAKVSVLNAGNDLTLKAGEDITSEGAQINAGGNATLDAGGEILLGAADNTMTSSSKNSSKSAGVSLTAGIDRNGKASLSVGVNAGFQKGNSSSEQAYKTNTKLDVAGHLDMTSGADTTLKGAQVTANTADLDVGGDLNIESLQDTGSNSSSSAGASVGVSWDITGGSLSGNASVNGSKGEGSKAWVTEQTGITTEETLDIEVAGNTDLKGGLIASENGDLILNTGTLTYSDLQDHDKQSNIGGSVGVNLSLPTGGNSDDNKGGQSDTQSGDQSQSPQHASDKPKSENDSSPYGGQLEGTYSNRDKRQITRATVGEGTIIIRDEAKQQELEDSGKTENVANLNRDVDAAQEITKDEEEYVGVYVSDESVKAAIKAGAKVAEVAELIIDKMLEDGKVPEEDKAAVEKIKKHLDDPKVLAQLRACQASAQTASFSIWDLIISPAYAVTDVCSVTTGGFSTSISLKGVRVILAGAATATTAFIGGLASGILLATTSSTGGEVNEKTVLENGTEVRITGPSDSNDRVLSIEYPNGEVVSLTLFQTGTGVYQLKSGTDNGKLLLPWQLEGIARSISSQIGITVVRNENRHGVGGNGGPKYDSERDGQEHDQNPDPNDKEPPLAGFLPEAEEFNAWRKKQKYEDASYHTTGNELKGSKPSNPETVFDNSYPVNASTTARRVGVDPTTGEYVVFDRTGPNQWHGHVRSWEKLSNRMKSALRKANLVTKKGKIK